MIMIVASLHGGVVLVFEQRMFDDDDDVCVAEKGERSSELTFLKKLLEKKMILTFLDLPMTSRLN